MVKPTLLVLAAGMGSRYGSLKQMDGVGPNGEAIIDYSVYDAIRAGFGKVVFVIRHSFEADFKEVFNAERFGGKIAVEYVFQELDYLPEGFTLPAERVKPWGTNHAVMMAADVINEPFAVINADDFYGRDGFAVLGKTLTEMTGKQNDYCMVGYRVGNTLSESGTVNRGVCATDSENYLTTVVERTGIGCEGNKIVFEDENGNKQDLDANTPVSMNISEDTIKIVALLHDICKVNFYKVDYRNAKNELGVWEKVPYYTVEDTIPYGHGEKSVMMITEYIKLTPEEKYAIRWHMGLSEPKELYGTMSIAFSKYPLALILFEADLEATYLFDI